MPKLVKVVTHHMNPKRAAELFAEEEIVALGWPQVGNLTGKSRREVKDVLRKNSNFSEGKAAKDAGQLLMFRDDVEKGDIIFAYQKGNTVALVGEVVDGKYTFNNRNKVGDPKGDIDYPQQKSVKWWDKPRNFNRSLLPEDLASWVAVIGTIAIRPYNVNKLTDLLQKIPTEETITKALEVVSEDEIKDYMESHLGEVEDGLQLVKREFETSSGPMDFLAKDKRGTRTVIEVKIKGDDHTVTQLRRYIRSMRNDETVPGDDKIRGIIVAQELTQRCIEETKEMKELGVDILLYKCRKKFFFSQYS